MIIICKCVANKHQKLKNFVLDCNKVNKEKALNKWLYFCKRMVYMYKTVASKLSISHIAWHNKEAWCYDKNESYMVNAPTTTTTVTTKIYFEWIKKVITLKLPSHKYTPYCFFLLTNYCALYIAGVSHHFYIIDKQLKDNDDFYETYTKYFW